MKKLGILFLFLIAFSCKEQSKLEKEKIILWHTYNDSAEVAANLNHKNERMRYKRIQSEVLDKNKVFLPLYDEVIKMTDSKYQSLKPLILEQNIEVV